MRELFSRREIRKEKAQSFVEVAIFFPVLLIMLSGLVEFGFLLNQYLNLMDGPREAARAAAAVKGVNSALYVNAAREAITAIKPEGICYKTDDIYVSVYGLTCSGISCTANFVGQNHCTADGTCIADMKASLPSGEEAQCAARTPISHSSQFNVTKIQTLVNGGAAISDFNSGVVVVELFYNYNQFLKLPWITVFVPDPLPISSYTMMPLPAAAP
jgi:Flp pilus assembly protein TadG